MIKRANRFQLHCDGVPVRSLSDLQEHFNVQDVLNNYKNGILLQWLQSRGLHDEARQLGSVKNKHDAGLVCDLAKIFGVPGTADDAEKMLNYSKSALKHIEEEKARIAQTVEQDDEAEEEVAEDEMLIPTRSDEIYSEFVDKLIANKKNREELRKYIDAFLTDHYFIFKIVYLDLIRILSEFAPLALLMLIYDKRTRPFYHEPTEEVLLLSTDKETDKAAALKNAKAALEDALLKHIGFSREKSKFDEQKYNTFVDRLREDGALVEIETNRNYTIDYGINADIMVMSFDNNDPDTPLTSMIIPDNNLVRWGRYYEFVFNDEKRIGKCNMVMGHNVRIEASGGGAAKISYVVLRLYSKS